ncbi:unnamed protein product [Closterium sp. NIES-65]|nr:unnamed protein product [Closterium sp. NIES-65]
MTTGRVKNLTSSYGGLRLSAAPTSAAARGSRRPPSPTLLRGPSASASSSSGTSGADRGASVLKDALTIFGSSKSAAAAAAAEKGPPARKGEATAAGVATGVAAGIAAQGVPFDLRLAVLLGGFAFEAYSTPTGSDKLSDVDGRQCSALFTSTPFSHELFQGQLSVRAITATGNIKALHAELALVTSAGKAATWNGVAHTTVKAQEWVCALSVDSKVKTRPLCLLSSPHRPACQQITFHSKDDDNDSDEDDCVVGTATIALTDLIKDTRIRDVVAKVTRDGKPTGNVTMEVGVCGEGGVFGEVGVSGVGGCKGRWAWDRVGVGEVGVVCLRWTMQASLGQATGRGERERGGGAVKGANNVTLAAWENLSRAAAGGQPEFFKSAFESVCFLSSGESDTQVSGLYAASLLRCLLMFPEQWQA